jgi:hypothetical protein
MRAKLAVVLVSILALGGASTAALPATASAASGPAAPAATARGAQAHHVVTLATGDRVNVTTDATGRSVATVGHARPGSAPFQTFRAGPHLYVIPHSAAAKIGHSLTLAQFDVTAPGTPVVQPHFPMHTLTVDGVDAAGKPAGDALVDVVNVDDVRKFFGFQGFFKGVAKFSVPDGHYSAMSIFFSFNPNGPSTIRVVSLPQFTVAGDSSLTIDARTATSKLSVVTPRPATTQTQDVDIARTDARGFSFSDGLTTGDDVVYVSPTVPVTVGQLHYSARWRLAAANGSYTYDVQFPTDGAIPAVQHYVVTPGQLATVSSRYYSEVARTGFELRFSFLPWQFIAFGLDLPLPQPLQRTEYVTANPDIVWIQSVTAFTSDTGAFVGVDEDAPRIFSPGQRLTSAWNKQPIHPDVPVDVGTKFGVFGCPVCRLGDTVGLGLFPFADNAPGHVGFSDFDWPGLTESVSLTLYENGKQVAADPNTGLYPLTPARADYRVVADTVRKAAYFQLSTSTHTEWSFASSHADGSGSLPAGWVCDLDGHTDCAVVPLMMARYDLPLSMSDRHAAGATSFDLAVDHLQGGPALPVSTAGVSVSYDDGATWVPATATALGGGRFRVAYVTPARTATNGYVAVKVNATDAAGGKLTQTVLRAYALS